MQMYVMISDSIQKFKKNDKIVQFLTQSSMDISAVLKSSNDIQQFSR